MNTYSYLPVNLPTYTNPYHHADFHPLQVCSLCFVWSILKHGNGALCDPAGEYIYCCASWGTHQLQIQCVGVHEWNVWESICFMASGFPPIVVTDMYTCKHAFTQCPTTCPLTCPPGSHLPLHLLPTHLLTCPPHLSPHLSPPVTHTISLLCVCLKVWVATGRIPRMTGWSGCVSFEWSC